MTVDHSDNLCTVGWTCIWGNMTPYDMECLLKACPRGHFSITSYDEKRYNRIWTPALLREALIDEQSQYLPYCRLTRGFYFDFPLDDNGAALLRQLGFDPEKSQFWGRRHEARTS